MMAESTPVSSVMRASTFTFPLLVDALTSLMTGGLVSSALAAEASKARAAKGARTRVRMARRLPHGPTRSTLSDATIGRDLRSPRAVQKRQLLTAEPQRAQRKASG